MHDAVLTDTHLMRCDLPDRAMTLSEPLEDSPLMELERVAGIHSLTNIWLHASSIYVQPAMRAALIADAKAMQAKHGPDSVWIEYQDHRYPMDEEVLSIRPRFRGDGRQYSIHFPAGRWDFDRLPAQEMAQTIHTLIAQLGVKRLHATPGGTGLAMMRRAFIGHAWEKAFDYQPTLDEGVIRYGALDMHWHRPVTEAATRVYAYDANSAYLACASSGDFGLAAPESTGTFQPKLPGFYAIEATPGGRFDGRALPSPFTNAYIEQVTGWYAEPLIRFAIEQGWTVQVREGVYWPKGTKHRMMTDWTAKLWQARMQTQGLTRTMVKQVMRGAMGRLAHYEADGRIYRPDIYGLIVAECRARRLRLAAKLADQGYLPFAVDVDAFYFASDAPIPIPLADTLGAYKDAGTYGLTELICSGDGDLKTALQLMKDGGK